MNFKKGITNEDVFRAILSAKTFIDDHVMENLSLDKILLQVGISKYHFIRVFKNTFGISPYQYQKRKRLDLAKIDLINGNDISYTAIRFGFPDVHSFSKAFKQQFGKTPGSIRKSNF
jgi:AraC-like DNA-binding protein